ncbi:FAD-dependent oxidoreductase [Bacteroides sp.]|uniref:FAD-dependent oxidoreductase n=1 Tax=Bacteroides sp. TaxID=29523 RepID=UPI0026162BA7|nr:FAD-dependent oxidoreductase [Bacteroides sp.]MDD3037281.1 FAD-dependent oxidoreductase [Bacteroides sp.]
MSKYNVVIIGAGAGGIGSAYALIHSGLSVLMIDCNPEIGGTHINGWVNVHASTPAPPFLKPIISRMLQSNIAKYINADYHDFQPNESICYDMSLLHSKYQKSGKEVNICFVPEKQAELYRADLKQGGIQIRNNTLFQKVVSFREGQVQSIQVVDLLTNKTEVLEADVFIDCSADSVLIGDCGGKRYIGLDARDKYFTEYGFIEESNKNLENNERALNYPTLMYRVAKGADETLPVSAFINDALLYEDNCKYVYVNTISYLGMTGLDVMKDKKQTYDELLRRVHLHWATIKEGDNLRCQFFHLREKRFIGAASMLGIRETYRTSCERMLNENHFYEQISSQRLAGKSNLDTPIAVGNHSVDIHGDAGSNIDAQSINSRMKPYGVPYGCLVPKCFTNVLVASRGAGFTHIAAASFRLNKDIMQLGWAAGKASLLFLSDLSKNDFRKIDARQLQLPQYTDFVGSVAELERIMK